MAMYEVKHACGHVETVDLAGPYKTREYRLEQMRSEICPACRKKELEEKSRAKGLAELNGTERQVAWALQIRIKSIYSLEALTSAVESEIAKMKDKNADELKEGITRLNECREYVIKNIAYLSEQSEAVFFIDNRSHFYIYNYCDVRRIRDGYECDYNFARYAKLYDSEHSAEAEAVRAEEAEKKAAEKEKQEEVHPENQTSDTVVTIKMDDEHVMLKSEYDASLVNAIHELDFNMCWGSGCWKCFVNPISGTTKDVVAEIGNKLLTNGFPVIFPTHEIAEMAITGNVKPYNFNRITGCKDDTKKLYVHYSKNDKTMYRLLKRMKGSRYYSKDTFEFPVSCYRELEELAEENDFVWSGLAKDNVEKYKQSIIVVNPVATTKRKEAVTPERKEFDLSDLDD